MSNKVGGGVYAITNTVTGQQYIGSCKHFGKRRGMHFWLLSVGRHYNEVLQAAWDEYGRDAFSFDVLEGGSDQDVFEEVFGSGFLISREQYYIDALKPAYNLSPTAGRSNGYRHTPETRARMSQAQRNRAPVSEETRRKRADNQRRKMSDPTYKAMIAAKVSASQKGRKMSPEHRASVKAAAMKRDHTHLREMAAAQRGVPLTTEHREKIRIGVLASKGRKAVIPVISARREDAS